ncbi:MAG: hypothetical protein AAF125_04095 [Chloroflexota bacterium]
MMTITQSDTSQVVWSPDRKRLAYITADSLRAYTVQNNEIDEQYHTLATGSYINVKWSPNGRYLMALREDNALTVFAFGRTRFKALFEASASTGEWLEDDELLFVPTDGGLMIAYMGPKPQAFHLAG